MLRFDESTFGLAIVLGLGFECQRLGRVTLRVEWCSKKGHGLD